MNSGASFLEFTHLFEARTGGYATYRIPGIVVTTKGSVLAYCEARKSSRGDWGAIDILLRRSTDGGLSWGESKQIGQIGIPVPKNPVALEQNLAGADEQTINNPVAIIDSQTGSVHLLFCAEYARCYTMRSDDDGQTFSPPVDITATFNEFREEYDWKVIATGPGHGIQLANGRLLVPVWLSTGTGGHAHRPSVVSVIYSDDAGETWRRGEIVVSHGKQAPNPSETAAVQLSDGRVMLNIRNESARHRRLVSYSKDGTSGWSEPVFDEALFEPICFGSLTRLSEQSSQNKNRLLFANPDSRGTPVDPVDGAKGRRKNLTLRLSYDEGQTWPVYKLLNAGISGYSDLAAGLDGTVYCFFEDGGIAGDMYDNAYLSVARLNLQWLTDGADRLAG